MDNEILKYSSMQKDVYENISAGMVVENHRQHNSNPDYKNILLSSISKNIDVDKKIFEFGFGCGRNIINIRKMGYKFVDGCDISNNNKINSTLEITKEVGDIGKTRLFVVDGTGINGVESDHYDFVFSTIVLQHICMYDIRFKILRDKYRILKKGGLLSFQMGFDNGKHPGYTIDYHDNYFNAANTNGFYDVCVTNPEDVVNDLKAIGFTNISYELRPAWEDGHDKWIFIKAEK
jgi:SAM-dependent methyltransferase